MYYQPALIDLTNVYNSEGREKMQCKGKKSTVKHRKRHKVLNFSDPKTVANFSHLRHCAQNLSRHII